MTDNKMTNITEYAKNQTNPFLDDMVHHVKMKEKRIIMGSKDANKVVSSEGELIGSAAFVIRKKVDETQFTKLFLNNIHQIFGLNKTAITVFAYIAKIVKPNTDYFYFDLDEFKEGTGYKTKLSVFKGISELLERKIIARTTKHYKYFINPTIFFNGNRALFITELVKSTNESTNQIQGTSED